jgi:hypothetical protein
LLTISENKSEKCDDTNLAEPTTKENTVDHPPRNLSIDLIKGITLASIGKFFFLPIMIWKDNSTETGVAIHLGLVFGYFLLSLVHVHSGMYSTIFSKKKSQLQILSFQLFRCQKDSCQF